MASQTKQKGKGKEKVVQVFKKEAFLVYLYRFLLIILYLFLAGTLFSTTLGIPGNWILLIIAVVVAFATHFTKLTLGYLLLCLALVVIGEIVEALLGTVVVAKKGGSKLGVLGTLIGGFTGAIIGTAYIPPLGSVLGAFFGAFLGAVAGEYLAYRRMDSAMRIGFWAFMGKMGSVFVKVCMGAGVLFIIVIKTWT